MVFFNVILNQAAGSEQAKYGTQSEGNCELTRHLPFVRGHGMATYKKVDGMIPREVDGECANLWLAGMRTRLSEL